MRFIKAAVLILLIISGVNLSKAELTEYGQGTYIGNISRDGDIISVSYKIYSNSPLWQQQMSMHNYTQEQLGNINSMEFNSLYNCSTGMIKMTDLKIYDTSDNVIGNFTDTGWLPGQGSGDMMCKLLNAN